MKLFDFNISLRPTPTIIPLDSCVIFNLTVFCFSVEEPLRTTNPLNFSISLAALFSLLISIDLLTINICLHFELIGEFETSLFFRVIFLFYICDVKYFLQ